MIASVDADEGPIEITDEAGRVRLSVGEKVFQGDGIPRAWTIAGAAYETVLVSRYTPVREVIENAGIVDVLIAQVLDEAELRLRAVITDEDFWSIEWRKRPLLKIGQTRDEEARIIDKETLVERLGTEVMHEVTVRWRWFVHKRSARPQMPQPAE